jgi:hypothetical protein
MIATTAKAFSARWTRATGSEKANYQLFMTELCRMLEVPIPEPATGDGILDNYVFERRVTFAHGDGSTSPGFIDCFRRGSFVLEAKKIRSAGTARSFDDAMLRARSQAEQYARALPADEGRPPFLLVVDVGNAIEIYSEFSRSGATYTPFPDPRSHRIKIDDLDRVDIRKRLQCVWLDPGSLDPALASAKVTREVAERLAEVAVGLEASHHSPEKVAQFLTRCLFSMFAEDVGLLPLNMGRPVFAKLLDDHALNPSALKQMMEALWQDMDKGGFCAVVAAPLLRFNGKLFKSAEAIELKPSHIELLKQAARADWKEVEPAIFGTLLERALNPHERHKLGAHFTPRSFVERLVVPTVVEPLREEWSIRQGAALLLAQEEKYKEAQSEIREFQKHLCEIRVLDPACGSGNFLYVTLEHMKRLEGEVLNQLSALGATETFETTGLTVDPHQFLGIEINPRAAAIAELVLWIGYLQWHFKTRGSGLPPEPVLRDFRNIETRDAVITWQSIERAVDDRGVPLRRWDGISTKKHPATGEEVPDETALVHVEKYEDVQRASWPHSDYIVGNPPYLGARTIRAALGDGYIDAVRSQYPEIPENADFVMYWWARAAELCATNQIKGFGLITTKSIGQAFSRPIVQRIQQASPQFGFRFVIPNHPWVDATDGAAVRVAMTACDNKGKIGRLLTVTREEPEKEGEVTVFFEEKSGVIGSDLTVGPNIVGCRRLKANEGMSCVGYQLSGTGFSVTLDQAQKLAGSHQFEAVGIYPLLSGRDLTQTNRGLYAIDLFEFSEDEIKRTSPAVYQWVLDRVKPERSLNNREALRRRWWIFGEARSTFRPAIKTISRLVATSLTAKYRAFVFVDSKTICDSTTVMIALDDAAYLGILSSQIHLTWALRSGGRLGVGDDARYLKASCFDKFPFPDANHPRMQTIRDLAESIDAHRKRQLEGNDTVGITAIYNVLEKLRLGGALSAKERNVYEIALVAVLRQMHDALDIEVLKVYGWDDLVPSMRRLNGDESQTDDLGFSTREECRGHLEETLLARLVILNHQRAAEETSGVVRKLRVYSKDGSSLVEFQESLIPVLPEQQRGSELPSNTVRPAWPKQSIEQIVAVANIIAEAGRVMTEEQVAASFRGQGRWRERLPRILDTLVAIGRLRQTAPGLYLSVSN